LLQPFLLLLRLRLHSGNAPDLTKSPRRSQSCCQCKIRVQDMNTDVLCQRPSPRKGAESFHKKRMKELQEDDEKHTLH